MSVVESRGVLSWILLGIPVGLLISVVVVMTLAWTGADSRGEKDGEMLAARLPFGAGKAWEPKLRDYVTVLSERIGERSALKPRELKAAELFVESTLGPSNIGYAVRKKEYEAEGRVFANLEAVLPGKGKAGEVVVVGAHYDTAVGSPGADDNGSGVAALLVLAEKFAGKRQERTIHWVAFCNEEPPWFQTGDMGSVRYAADLKRSGTRVVAMLSLESIGYFRDDPGSQKYPEPLAALYPDTGNFLAVVGNLENRRLVDYAFERVRETGLIPVEKGAFPQIVPGVGWSDHWAFWQEGYPAVMLTGTAPYRNPHYHLESDRANTLDYGRLGKVVEAVERLIVGLANDAKEKW